MEQTSAPAREEDPASLSASSPTTSSREIAQLNPASLAKCFAHGILLELPAPLNHPFAINDIVQKCLHQSGEDLSPIQINSIKTTLAEGLFANPNATIGHLAALSACDLSHLTSKKLAEFIERCINRRATEDAAADKLKQKIIDNSDIDASTEPMGQEAQLVMPALPNPEDASINQSADQSATNNTTADKLDHTAKLNYEVEMIFFHFDQFASMPIALADAEVTKRLLILFRNNRLLWGKMMDRIDRELPVFGFNSATAHSWLC